ncbi:MAG: integration host factor subunit beta [Myxococcales bacterium]|nr:integration host factor subunit beta [Myxococcales bacterium]
MTKSDLIEKVAAQLNLPKGKAELIINCIFDSMEESLKQGNRIEIRGFGSFEIRRYKAYEGRNPRTGDPVGVNPKRLPFFKVGKELKERVNAGGAPTRTPRAAKAAPAPVAVAPTPAAPAPVAAAPAPAPVAAAPAATAPAAAPAPPVAASKPAAPAAGKKKSGGKAR